MAEPDDPYIVVPDPLPQRYLALSDAERLHLASAYRVFPRLAHYLHVLAKYGAGKDAWLN